MEKVEAGSVITSDISIADEQSFSAARGILPFIDFLNFDSPSMSKSTTPPRKMSKVRRTN